MPEFRSKEEVFEKCNAEGNLIPLDRINLHKVIHTLQIAEEDLETARESIKKKRLNSGYKSFYDVLRELAEAYVLFDKLRSRNHQCLFAYLCVKHPELELDWNFFEKVRTKRNGINYYSQMVSLNDWKQVEVQFSLYINLMKNRIATKVKEHQ